MAHRPLGGEAPLALTAFSAARRQTTTPSFSAAKPRFQVVDGDIVKLGAQPVRLFGIDAPEKGQTCDDGKWLPGPLSKKALEDFVELDDGPLRHVINGDVNARGMRLALVPVYC